ncbi:uncharacterized protein LOC143602768 [Bidens hawaiensis]|uniref:uncharacterized protein LOC143602768 n=1 Tax=Bidens hawaiensis TaxID=980011 RepID=UPI00404B3814
MDTSNGRPTQGAHGAVGEITIESGDWRSHPQRQRIMNKILDILKKHLPFSGYDRQQELKKIAERVEEEIYTAATSQSEYSRKLCFNMLSIETRLQNPMSGPSIPQTDNLNGGDWQEEVYQKIKAMTKLYELESSDWRAGLKAESRQRVLNKMIKSCHHPSLRPEELQELKKKTVRFEEKTYIAATSQAEYLCKISLKMLKMENSLKYPMLSNSTADSDNPLDPGSQVMQQVNNQGQRFSIPVTSNNFQQIMSQSMNTNIGSIGMQGSSSLSSALPPGSGLQQPPMANVAGQSSNLQKIQNMSSAQQNTVGNIMGYNNFANQRQIPGRQQLIPKQLPQQPPQTQNSHYLYRQHLQQMAKQAHIQQQQPMRSHMMHNNIGSTGMQGSSSLSSAMLPGSSLQQPIMVSVAGQISNIQNMSHVQRSHLMNNNITTLTRSHS